MHRRDVLGYGVGMLMGGMVTVFGSGLSGCTALWREGMGQNHQPQERSVHLPDGPQTAFKRAYAAYGKLDGKVDSSNQTLGILSGELKAVIRLDVTIEPEGTGSLVTARGHVIQGKRVSGTFTEVDDYVAVL